MRTYLELGAVVVAILACWFAYITGVEHGRLANEAEHTKANKSTQAAIDTRSADASTVNSETTLALWAKLPPIELRTDEARERVRIIYRNTPAPAVGTCRAVARPVSVQQELTQARSRIAPAARGEVRAEPHADAQPAAGLHDHQQRRLSAEDGRMGDRGAGLDRARGDQGVRGQGVRAGPP